MEQYKATLMDEPAVLRALKRISHEIVERNNGAKNLCIMGIKRRGTPLANIVADNIAAIEGIRPPCATLDITLYRDDLSYNPKNAENLSPAIPFSIEGMNIVLVDDVLYTGRTVRSALDALKNIGRAATVQFAVLVDRGHRELPIRGDYVGKNIPTSKTEKILVRVPPYDKQIAVELYEG